MPRAERGKTVVIPKPAYEALVRYARCMGRPLGTQVDNWAVNLEAQLVARLTEKERAAYFNGTLNFDTAEIIRQRATDLARKKRDDDRDGPEPESGRVRALADAHA